MRDQRYLWVAVAAPLLGLGLVGAWLAIEPTPDVQWSGWVYEVRRVGQPSETICASGIWAQSKGSCVEAYVSRWEGSGRVAIYCGEVSVTQRDERCATPGVGR